jgi:hypothetical protein
MSRFEEARQEEARTARLAAQTEALKNWMAKTHPEIRLGEALLKAFQENMLGAFFTADDADWEYALNMIDTRYTRQHVNTPAEENARRRALSITELQQLARLEHPVSQPDLLPQTYIPIGKNTPVELTADVISRAGSRTGEISTADLKFLIRRYGASEVNKRLGVKPTVQPGYIKSVRF